VEAGSGRCGDKTRSQIRYSRATSAFALVALL